jgi:hypothetical protein
MDSKQYSRIVGSSKEGRENESIERKLDFYPTPPEAVWGLMKKVSFDKGIIWEPACGDGAISDVLVEKYGKSVFPSDIHDWGCVPFRQMNFLDTWSADYAIDVGCTHIITNPPYKLALEFADYGNRFIERTGGKLALLLRIQWLEGIKRGEFFKKHPPSWVHVFSRRLPRMHRGNYEGKKTSSMIAFAWFLWDNNNHLGETRLGWI